MTENRLPPEARAVFEPREFPMMLDRLAWSLLPAFLPQFYGMVQQQCVQQQVRGGAIAVPNGATAGVQINLPDVPWTDSEMEALAIQLAYRTAARMLKYGETCAGEGTMPGLMPVPSLLTRVPPQ